MKLSTRSRYGVRFMLDLALHAAKGPVQLGAVARRQGIGVKYLEQIASRLKKADFIISVRGPKGGHLLSRPPEEITVAEVVTLLEGGLKLAGCSNGDGECDRWERCVTRVIWAEAAQAFLEKLEAINLKDLMDRVACVGSPEECDEAEDHKP
ncbi:MAG: Rrf2 family transcriptional regulator [Syntrophobacteraceae bacterium]|nr:Rrf2 family transcriptional regulator [Syntrophobacteraceae bacterium]